MPVAALSVPLRAPKLVAFKCQTARICVLWQLQPYLSVHKFVYFGHFNLTFQCTNMCTLATSALPSSAQICVLWPLTTLPFSAQICLLWPLNVNEVTKEIIGV
jgi:hypothetical protein